MIDIWGQRELPAPIDCVDCDAFSTESHGRAAAAQQGASDIPSCAQSRGRGQIDQIAKCSVTVAALPRIDYAI